MKIIKLIKSVMVVGLSLMAITSCDDMLNEPLEAERKIVGTDYTQTENMFQLLTGSYALFYEMQWETFPTISVRGDDVDPKGDQVPLQETDEFNYKATNWMYNSTWLNLYTDIIRLLGNIDEIKKYQEFAANPAEADQYIAEIKVLNAFNLFQLSRLWGAIVIPTSSFAGESLNAPLSSKDEVMQYISGQMDEAIPLLPIGRPNERTDIPGGVTKYTALAIKAMANLEMGNYQAVADATGEIIDKGGFSLYSDFYDLFKLPGKLSDENLLELQYSDFGQSSGEKRNYNFAFFGPPAAGYGPFVQNAKGGWGFWEPTTKYIKFMLDRGEQERLVTSVLFTPAGIAEIESDPNYADLPAWISNITPDADTIKNNARLLFVSGKHYLPSNQLTPGRTDYGTNNNFICIRYAQILLMHAEALTQGATSSVMSADDAVNAVRSRAGFTTPLTGVTLQDVLDEKFAEFAMEWGIRFYDLVRHNKTGELNYGGRTFGEDDRYLPYPLEQRDILPQLDVDQKEPA